MKKYLIAVDDEPDLQFVFEHFFEDVIKSGELELFYLGSAHDCLEKLESLQGEIIVLTDISMPELSGIDLVRICCEKYPGVKLFLVSAYDQQNYQDDMEKWNARGYISKPVDFDKLRDLVFKELDISS